MISLKKAAICLSLSLVASSAALAQEVTLRLHQFLPPQATIPAKAIAPWAKKIEAESNGRITTVRLNVEQIQLVSAGGQFVRRVVAL